MYISPTSKCLTHHYNELKMDSRGGGGKAKIIDPVVNFYFLSLIYSSFTYNLHLLTGYWPGGNHSPVNG